MNRDSSRNHLSFFSSSIGQKFIVAVTGTILMLFLIGHLLGNLTIFFGSSAFNQYAHFIKNLGELLWIIRLILIVSIVSHIYFTTQLYRENKKANPIKYAVKNKLNTKLATHWMLFSGIIILVFICVHLSQFTLQITNPEYKTWLDQSGYPDVYRVVTTAFSHFYISFFYILALAVLCKHLSHGMASVFQTLGLSTQKLRPKIEKYSKIVTWIIFILYISIPVSIFLNSLIK